MAKKLLNEATVRRFQKLASVSPISEMYQKNEYLKEEEDMEDMDDAPMGDAPEDMGDAPMGDAPEVEITEEDAEEFLQNVKGLEKLADKLAQAMPEMADDMGDEEPMDMGDEDMGDEDMGDEEAIMEALRGISYVPSKSEIVNEVAQRVARRLKAAKLHEAKLNRALGRRK